MRKGLEKIYVKVGYQGTNERTVYFMGKKLCRRLTDDPNSNYKDLYKVEGGYRVLEVLPKTQFIASYARLSPIFATPCEVARYYRQLANYAVEKGIFSIEEIAEPASEEEQS